MKKLSNPNFSKNINDHKIYINMYPLYITFFSF